MPEYESEMRAVMMALNDSNALPHCVVTGSSKVMEAVIDVLRSQRVNPQNKPINVGINNPLWE